MKGKLLIGILLLVLAAGVCHGEVAVGVSAGYPLAVALIYEAGFDTDLLLAGVAFRWKPSAFLLDLGVSRTLGLPILYGFLDIGVCADLAFLRFGLVGGVDLLRFSDPDWGSFNAAGFNAKVNLDFKIGRLTVGLSGSIPLDLLLQALTDDGIDEDFRLFAAQSTLNVMYWFGDSGRPKLR